jgi:hypothetical protein
MDGLLFYFYFSLAFSFEGSHGMEGLRGTGVLVKIFFCTESEI